MSAETGVGPAIASLLVDDIGADALLLIASAMVALTLPYVAGGAFAALQFGKHPPGRVAAWDLVGAGLGPILAAVAVPWLREEGSLLLLGVLGAVPLVVAVGGRAVS